MNQINYREFEKADFEALLEMGLKLWTDLERDDLNDLLQQSLQSKKYKIWMAKTQDDECIGFSIFSIRTDYVEGAIKSPTGYLEGIYVKPLFRKMGISKEFLRLGENWLKENGCSQMGSDTWLTDVDSRAFHKKVGFWEEEEVVHFLKNIE